MSLIVEKSKPRDSGRREPSATETAILDVAGTLFRHYGFGKVTMDEIAAEAGMGKASLYYYFPTKEHLFSVVMNGEQRRFLDELKAIAAEPCPASDRIRKYVRQRFPYFDLVRNYRFMDVDPAVRNKPMMRALWVNFRKEELLHLRHIFRDGKKRGEFAAENIDRAAEVFLHTFHGLRLRFLHITSPFAADDREAFEELRDEMFFLTEVFLKGVGANHKRTPIRRHVQGTNDTSED